MLPSSQNTTQPSDRTQARLDRFLVCGLGSLGQHCVAVLKDYGVAVSAIDEVQHTTWEIPDLPNLLEKLLIGDCRQASILEQAKIKECRSILLVTGNERVNIEAAFTARLLNPQVRLILRSDKQNLNELLGQSLGNFIAFEPTQLSASAFALTALGSETIGYFNLEGNLLRVVKHKILSRERWSDRWLLHGLNSETRCILSYTSESSKLPKQFYEWEPEAKVRVGDTITYIEVTDKLAISYQEEATKSQRNIQLLWEKIILGMRWKNLKSNIAKFWRSHYQSQNQIRRVATIYVIAVLILWLCGVILYRLYYPEIGIAEALYAPAVLLLGGYGDLFGSVKFASQPVPAEHMPWWLRLFSFGLTLTGEAFVGILYALLTDSLLSSRFNFFSNRPPVPLQDHVVLIGLNRVGQRVAAFLQELKQPLVGISHNPLDQNILPQMPLIVDNIAKALTKVNLANAKSIIVVADDDMENLEIGLMAHAANPASALVIRTYDQHFSDNIARLFPYAQVLCGSALSAEIFGCAAFGENVLSLFHFYNQTVMVTEYNIETGDTLNGLILAEIAYGYGVVPILYQKYPQQPPELMPSDDTRLYAGDRLIVLATSTGLQRIEWGELLPRCWQVQFEKALNTGAISDAVDEIALIVGCSLNTAKELMNNLPSLSPPLYKYQAQRLMRELSKVKVIANLIFIE